MEGPLVLCMNGVNHREDEKQEAVGTDERERYCPGVNRAP